MLEILTVIAVGFLVAVIPVMLAAKLVGAGRQGFGAALLAVVLQAILSIVLRSVALNPLLIIIVAVLVGSAIYAYVLDTTMVRGFLISVVAAVISVLIVVGLAGLFALGVAVA